jgi:mycofactocin precursor
MRKRCSRVAWVKKWISAIANSPAGRVEAGWIPVGSKKIPKNKWTTVPDRVRSYRTADDSRKEVYVEDKSVPGNEAKVKRDCPAGMEDSLILEEFEIEELSVDGVCGVY